MRFLDDLEREIERIAYAAEPVPARRRWWRRSTALLVLLPLCVGTVAVAATTGIIFGEPVKNPPGTRQDPKVGVGVNDGPGKLFDVRAADPEGGPEWGVRLVKTSRGLGCLQTARVVDGKLGVLGRDGAFDNDGKFHELGAEVLETTFCQQSDSNGNVFIAVTAIGLPASADGSACRARSRKGANACPRGSLRDVFSGLLGPEAAAITYREGGKLIRQEVKGPEGAYLVVRATNPNRTNVGWWSPSLSPNWVESIEFRDGSSCRPAKRKRINGVRSCPLKGYVAPKVDVATRAEIETPLRVVVGTKREKPRYPGITRKDLDRLPWQRRITFSFRARRAADAKAFYAYRAELSGRGPRCGYSMGGPVARDIKAGTVITETLWVNHRCRGKLTISVGYEQPRTPSQMPFQPVGRPNAKVGTATVQLPDGP
ncbi:hypothetical protein OJ998_17915 [Solirubrobacter taibaiensis]|nr:hypothetical protein [Solirubrobacter taibaiensis]